MNACTLSSNPCKNGAICNLDYDDTRGYKCACAGGYLGDDCKVTTNFKYLYIHNLN